MNRGIRGWASRVAIAALAALTAVTISAAGAIPATPPPTQGHFASVNGLQMYYEVHGPDTGRPLVLLHGSLSGIPVDFAELLPLLARDRRVIAVEHQAHGHTADIDRPLRIEPMASDVTELLRQLHVQQVDVLGYSTGAAVGLQMALEHPELVHKLVMVTPRFDQSGFHPGLIEQLQDLQPEMLHGTPFHDYYLASAPRPEDFPTLIEKNKDLQLNYPNYPPSTVQALTAPVLLAVGDSDIVRLEHVVEFFGLLGGGVNGDLDGLPDSQLVVLPATTHLTAIHRPELLTVIPAFLGHPDAD